MGHYAHTLQPGRQSNFPPPNLHQHPPPALPPPPPRPPVPPPPAPPAHQHSQRKTVERARRGVVDAPAPRPQLDQPHQRAKAPFVLQQQGGGGGGGDVGQRVPGGSVDGHSPALCRASQAHFHAVASLPHTQPIPTPHTQSHTHTCASRPTTADLNSAWLPPMPTSKSRPAAAAGEGVRGGSGRFNTHTSHHTLLDTAAAAPPPPPLPCPPSPPRPHHPAPSPE